MIRSAPEPSIHPEVTVAHATQPTLFHNPQCSKSRGAKQLLDEAGIEYEIVEYLKTPPTAAELHHILELIDDPPAALVRRGDPKFKALGLDKADFVTEADVVALLVEHPELMERPVVVVGDRAVIGRPPERVNELL